MSEQALDTNPLTPAENAFFDSKGATELPAPEQKPEAAPEGEAKPDAKPDDDSLDKVKKLVPLEALHEERGKRKDMEKRLRDIEIENARYAERFKLVEEQAKPKADPVDRNADPFAYLNQVGDKTETIEQRLQRFERQQDQAAQQQQVLSLYSNNVKAFKGTTPDFDDAYKVAVSARQRVYEIAGHPNPEGAAQADEFQLVTALLQQGKNPAEAIYEIAKTYGYKPEGKDEPKGNAAAKLDSIEKGQAANKSLASAGGGGGPDEMTAERLMKMPMDEFQEWTEKNPAKAKRLMGG